MKAIRKVMLSWGNMSVPVKIMPLVDADSHKIPSEIDVHRECNQKVVTENLCPECQKLFRSEMQTFCPQCHQTIGPEIHNLCSKCRARVEESIVDKWCPSCEKKIIDKDIKSVFLVGKNQLMELTEEERQEWKKTFPDKDEIKVNWVIRKREINPVYFLTAYTLVPDKKGEYGYEFFRQVLSGDEFDLIADMVISTRNYRSIITHENGSLLLITLINYDEIVWPEIPQVQLPADLIEKGKDIMFKMAERRFKPEEHARNPYREYFETLVARKIEQKEVAFKPPAAPSLEALDEITKQLMANLPDAQEKTKKVTKK